jgi:hypothetical protein
MKTLLSFGALMLAIAATTISAKAECVGGDFGIYYVVCPPPRPAPVRHVTKPPHPQQREKEAHRPAAAPTHHVTKRPQRQQPKEKASPEEKAPPAGTPPALPPR